MADDADALPGSEPTPSPAESKSGTERDLQLQYWQADIAQARSEVRRERASLAAERDELAKLRQEAETTQAQAARQRLRVHKLVQRYSKRVKERWEAARKELAWEKAAVDVNREQLSDEIARFEVLRSDFHVSSAEEKEHLRQSWAAIEHHRRRLESERAEFNEYIAAQESSLALRSREITEREGECSQHRKQLDRETANLRAESAGLETRIRNSRSIVEQLEQQLEHLRAELLKQKPLDDVSNSNSGVPLNPQMDRDLTQWAAELDHQERELQRERASLKELRSSFDRETLSLTDRQRVVAEQITLLSDARTQWQESERRTIQEMEELAGDLRHRERDLDVREERLTRADARRREEGYELWQLRLQLEAWQSKLTAVGQRWHSDRDIRETDFASRVRALARREMEIDSLLNRWASSREMERQRLRAELNSWADDRVQLNHAAKEYEVRAKAMLETVAVHAARAMAAENLLKEKASHSKVNRRIEVLHRRWERIFRKHLEEIARKRKELAEYSSVVDSKVRDLHEMMGIVHAREMEYNNSASRSDAQAIELTNWLPPEDRALVNSQGSGEVQTLREELERMANVLLNAGVPEAPDKLLPSANVEIDATGGKVDILPFPQSRVA